MDSFPFLSFLIFLPLIGGLFVSLLSSEDENAFYVASFVSFVSFILSVYLVIKFDPLGGYQFQEIYEWSKMMDPQYAVGIDGIALPLIVLTTFLTFLSILLGWGQEIQQRRSYLVAFLVLEGALIGVFSARDLFLFYIFFEMILIPMFLIVGVWGGAQRVYASYKLFLYTFLGSLLMLAAMILIYTQAGQSHLDILGQSDFNPEITIFLWVAFFIAFAVKLPVWPFHTWLPDAHVQAPTAGSVMLAGILLKVGGYGMIRLLLPLFPEASLDLTWLVFGVSIVGVVYTSMVALVQDDMKKLVAYSSVAHMAFVTAGFFTFSTIGIQGGLFQMISHGLISGALFICVGVLYARVGTRSLAAYGGVANKLPFFSAMMMIFVLAATGLPGTAGFVGEVLVLISLFKVSGVLAFLLGTSLFLGAAYALWLYRRVIFGKLGEESEKLSPLNNVEKGVLASLALCVVGLGVWPQPLMNVMAPSIEPVTQSLHAALEKQKDPQLAMIDLAPSEEKVVLAASRTPELTTQEGDAHAG